jgi:hypothetical protein
LEFFAGIDKKVFLEERVYQGRKSNEQRAKIIKSGGTGR